MAPRGEILPFTALRGLAAWWVVAYHMREHLPIDGVIRSVIARGALAVDLFFIMSGFVMALSYARGFDQGITWRSYGRFIGLRLARIYPLHAVILVLFISVPFALAVTGRDPLTPQFPPGYFVKSLLLIQNWGFTGGIGWNLPAWSISTEMLFYLLFPFILGAAHRLVAGIASHLAALAWLLAMLAIVSVFAGGLTNSIEEFGALRCLFECTLGLVLFRLTVLCGTPSWLAHLLLLATASLVAAYAAGLARDFVVIPFAFLCLLWGLLDPGLWLGRLLSNPLLLWLGRLSYATYLIHVLAKYWVKFILLNHVSDTVLALVYGTGVLLASIVLHYAIELPSRRWGRALVRRWFDGTPAPRPGWTGGVGEGVRK